MISVVTARYARALADVVAAEKTPAGHLAADPAQIVAQLREVEAIIEGSAELRNALASPAVAPSRKRAVMARLIEPMKVSPHVRNFLFVVIDHRRSAALKSIIEAFEALIDQRLGYLRADVSSARALTGAQQAAMEVQLSRLAGKKAKLRFTTDPELVAGVVARVGSTVYDGSVRGQLERLRVKLGSAV
jgi:F-type H+-transporting ATPase subunit delta